MPANAQPQGLDKARMAKAIARIRLDFVNGLFPLINEMEHQRRTLELESPHTLHALASLQRCVHKLSGIAGSVGFAAIGDRASRLDVTLSHLRKGSFDKRDIAALQAPLEDLLGVMEAVLDENL